MTALALVPAAPAAATPSTTWRGDAQHRGFVGDGGLKPPFRLRWSRVLGPLVGQSPVIADGRVFVVAGVQRAEPGGFRLHALDAASGRTLWSVGAEEHRDTHLAYADGMLFAVDRASGARAFDATTGRLLWSRSLDRIFTWPPVVADGVLYVNGASGGGKLWALRASDGELLWVAETPLASGGTSPTLDATTVYVADAGPQVYAFDRRTGALRWHHEGRLHGGGGRPPALFGGALFQSAFGEPRGHVLDAQTGRSIGTYDGVWAPAVTPGGIGVFMSEYGVLSARRLDTATTLWTARLPTGGQTPPPPLVVGDAVLVATGDSGAEPGLSLVAYDLRDGTRLWEDRGGGHAWNVVAGDGLVVLPAHHGSVRAYEPAPNAPPRPLGDEPAAPDPVPSQTPASEDETASDASLPPAPPVARSTRSSALVLRVDVPPSVTAAGLRARGLRVRLAGLNPTEPVVVRVIRHGRTRTLARASGPVGRGATLRLQPRRPAASGTRLLVVVRAGARRAQRIVLVR